MNNFNPLYPIPLRPLPPAVSGVLDAKLTGLVSTPGLINENDTVLQAFRKLLNTQQSSSNPLTTILSGYADGNGNITATDTVLSAFGKAMPRPLISHSLTNSNSEYKNFIPSVISSTSFSYEFGVGSNPATPTNSFAKVFSGNYIVTRFTKNYRSGLYAAAPTNTLTSNIAAYVYGGNPNLDSLPSNGERAAGFIISQSYSPLDSSTSVSTVLFRVDEKYITLGNSVSTLTPSLLMDGTDSNNPVIQFSIGGQSSIRVKIDNYTISGENRYVQFWQQLKVVDYDFFTASASDRALRVNANNLEYYDGISWSQLNNQGGINAPLTGYATLTGPISATDSILQAFGRTITSPNFTGSFINTISGFQIGEWSINAPGWATGNSSDNLKLGFFLDSNALPNVGMISAFPTTNSYTLNSINTEGNSVILYSGDAPYGSGTATTKGQIFVGRNDISIVANNSVSSSSLFFSSIGINYTLSSGLNFYLVNNGGFNNAYLIDGSASGSNDNSAILNLSTTTRGFLPPRLTTTQRNAISSPANGLIIYNSTTNQLEVRQNGSWVGFSTI